MAKKKKKAAKAPVRAAKAAPAAPAGAYCPSGKCGPGCFFASIGASALMAIGLFLIVNGVLLQSNATPMLTTSLWYLGGFLLVIFGKCILCKACMKCWPR